MRAIIVAAGKGTRIPEVTNHVPKCLIKLGDKTLIEREMDMLYEVGIKDITVVIGHLAHMIEELLSNKVDYVFNPFYSITNSLVSLWFAKERMKDGFVYLHSDIIFEASVIEKILLDQNEICLAVQRKMTDEEDMKVRVERERIVEINKAIPLDKAYGEFIGIAKFEGEGVNKLQKALDKIIRTEDLNAYFESAVQYLIENREAAYFIDSADSFYAEIDYLEDLEKLKLPK